MPESGPSSHRQQDLYWNEMVRLRVNTSYIRFYRDWLGRWVTIMGTIRAVASCTSIALWAVWKQYPLVWAAIIAASQVLDALKDVFPVTRRYKAASELAIVLDSLFIDAQLEWENIFSGRYTDDQINTRLHKLRKLQHDAECKGFPSGLPKQSAIADRAQSDANIFFLTAYHVQSSLRGGNAHGEYESAV